MSSTWSALCADGVFMLLRSMRIALIRVCNMLMTWRSSVVFSSVVRDGIEVGGDRCTSETGCVRGSDGHSSRGGSLDPDSVFGVSVFAELDDGGPVLLA